MHITDYLSRIGKSYGFGIQSPWAYSFVKEVIYEKWPYYGYAEIEEKYNSRKERKRQKLYLRIRNFLHGKQLVIVDMRNIIDKTDFSFFDADGVGAAVIENTYYNNKGAECWEQIKQDEKTGITFDLYDVCICFPRSEMYKQHYKMNF